MAHARKQVRDALATLLTGLATTADRVYVARVTPIPADELPALAITLDDETIELGSASSPVIWNRTAFARVQGLAALLDGLDDELDQIALEIEQAVAGDATLLGGVLNEPLRLVTIEPERSAEGERPVGRITLTFLARYETTAAAPDVTL